MAGMGPNLKLLIFTKKSYQLQKSSKKVHIVFELHWQSCSVDTLRGTASGPITAEMIEQMACNKNRNCVRCIKVTTTMKEGLF